MCADVLVYNLDQWRSSDSSTDISITIFHFREGQLTLLTHILHRALSASSETWSCGCHMFSSVARPYAVTGLTTRGRSSNVTVHVKTLSSSVFRRPHGGARALLRECAGVTAGLRSDLGSVCWWTIAWSGRSR